MPPQLRPIDVEALLNDVIHQALLVDRDDVTVTPERPFTDTWSDALPPLVRLTANGGRGPYAVVLHDPAFVGEVWAESSVGAFDLAADVVGYIGALSGAYTVPGRTGRAVVYSAEATLPRWLPDPLTQIPRYIFTGTLTARLQGA